MGLDLSEILVIGVSSRALFDLEGENALFDREGVEGFRRYQLAHEGDMLAPGTAFPLVQSLLQLNERQPGLILTNLAILNQDRLTGKSAHLPPMVELGYRENLLSIGFAATDLLPLRFGGRF